MTGARHGARQPAQAAERGRGGGLARPFPFGRSSTGITTSTPGSRSGTELSAHYDALVACVEAFEAEDRPPPPDVVAEAWRWSEAPEKRLKRRRALLEAAEALLLKFSAEELAAGVAEYGAGWRWFEFDDNYQGSGDRRTVSVGFVTAMVATLIGAFPSGSPSSPAVFTRMMIEELIAAESTASRIECAIRTLIRTRTFLPAIAEVLGAHS